jgi:tripartite-type tricarboxylate transporter receptor subunit TctC
MKLIGALSIISAATLVLSACSEPAAPPEGSVSDFPNKRIELVVPFAAGGGTDALARLWGGCLSDELGQTVTIVNYDGGAGAVGALALSKAKPDGYTVGVSTATTMQAIPLLTPDVGYTPESYDYLGLIGTAPDVIFTRADSAYNTVQDVIDAAKADPSMKVAGYVSTSSSRFRPEELKINNDVEWKTIPFPTADGITGAVLGGEANVGASYLSIPLVEQVKAGTLKILGAGMDISSAIPGVPTYEEEGIKAFSGPNAVNFYLHAPKGVPADAVQVWGDAVEACRSAESLKGLVEVSALPSEITGQAVLDFAASESGAYKEYIQNYYPPKG